MRQNMDPVTIRVPVAVMDPGVRAIVTRIPGTVKMPVVPVISRKTGSMNTPVRSMLLYNMGAGPMLLHNMRFISTAVSLFYVWSMDTFAGPVFLHHVRFFSMGSRAATSMRFLVMTARTGFVFLLKLSIVRT
jgi:hypothetical protein